MSLCVASKLLSSGANETDGGALDFGAAEASDGRGVGVSIES